MNRKAISEQVFIYIFAMVVIGLTLFFGIKMIKQTTDFGTAVDISVFYKDLDNAVQELYSYSEGSTQNLIINRVPTQIKAVCFIDLTKEFGEIPYPEIKNYAEANRGSPGKNLFFVSDKFIEPKLISHLLVEPNPFCKRIERSSFKAAITNTGDKVKIEE